MSLFSKTIYVDEDRGKDDSVADGSEQHPYQTLLFALIQYPPSSSDGPQYQVRKPAADLISADSSAGLPSEFKPVAKSALKKAINLYEQHKRKLAKGDELALREKQDAEKRQLSLEEAKKIKITKDASLPEAIKIRLHEKDPKIVKLRSGKSGKDEGYGEGKGSRVRVTGRVHRLRSQKEVIFVTLQDGYGFLQCVFTGDLVKTYDAMTLTLETSMEIFGEMWEVPPKQHAPDDRELHADYFEIIGKAVGDKEAITTRVAPDSDPQTLYDNRHLVLRGETSASVMKVRAALLRAFRQTYEELSPSFLEVTPPCMVQTQVEGGATLFAFDYYGEKAYLTQSSQLYLETCVPSLGNVFCISPSFRAEKSLTRRHLSEYTHIEAELDFISFEDLLDHLELLISTVVTTALSHPPTKKIVYELNPSFQIPARPFLRMKYSNAILWLREHDIRNENGDPHQAGDDIAEAAERKMTDIINRPIFLTHFPVEIKAFYMKRDPSDLTITESVDVLMPGVGEIVGAGMRMDDYDELMEGYKREGIDPAPYYWYTDQRKYVMLPSPFPLLFPPPPLFSFFSSSFRFFFEKQRKNPKKLTLERVCLSRYGTSPHGGYGLGLERFLAWLCGRYTVRECCLYPRFTGRCAP